MINLNIHRWILTLHVNRQHYILRHISTLNLKICSRTRSLTVMRSSFRSSRTLSFFQKMVGSGCPRGGWHSRVADSPSATTTSWGFWRKSSLSTAEKRRGEKKRRMRLGDGWLKTGWKQKVQSETTTARNVGLTDASMSAHYGSDATSRWEHPMK